MFPLQVAMVGQLSWSNRDPARRRAFRKCRDAFSENCKDDMTMPAKINRRPCVFAAPPGPSAYRGDRRRGGAPSIWKNAAGMHQECCSSLAMGKLTLQQVPLSVDISTPPPSCCARMWMS